MISLRTVATALLPLTLAAGSACSAVVSNTVLAEIAAEANATAQYGESAAVRSYFYIGGSYDVSGGGHLHKDQMYVEKLVPVNGITKKTPIVLMHGQAQTGTVSYLYIFPTIDSCQLTNLCV